MFFKILLSIIGVFFGLYIFFSIKYNNPNKFIFIWGKKGSGKSCFMVHEMVRYMKKGWTIYTDMNVNLPNIRLITDTNNMFKDYTPDKHSVIFLDEIGVTWHARDFKQFDKKIREWFKFQRKYKCRVYANSQDFDIDKGLRSLTDSMILQSNIGNFISISRPIIRKVGFTDATFTGESKLVDQLQFAPPWNYKFYFMPKYFNAFNSYDAPYRPPMPYDVTKNPLTYKQLRKLGFSRKLAKACLSSSSSSAYSSNIQNAEDKMLT